MFRLIIANLFLLLTSVCFAADWPTGAFIVANDKIEIRVQVLEVSESSVEVTVSWSSNAELNLPQGSITTDFEFIKTNIARLTATTDPLEYFQLKLDSDGEVVFSYSSQNRPELNTTGYLKPDHQELLSFNEYTVVQAREDIPELSTWTEYLNNDIWPFWSGDTARQFVTYRCNNGELPRLDALCPELNTGWIREGLGRDYTRMVSRQTYAYGVIFHLTGEPKALERMEQGVDILLSRINDDGSVETLLEEDDSILTTGQHTSQDLAYVQVGLAMAFYLTGDKQLLNVITKVKKHIFSKYRNDDWGMLAWTLKDQRPGDSTRQELVAQLDQLNAYMLLVYPLLPEQMKVEWHADIEWLITVLLDKFYLPEQQRFAGQITNGKPNRPGERHNDFGHSVKSFWMILLAGELLDQPDWITIAEAGIDAIAKQAFRFHDRPEQYSTWANQSYSSGASWWGFAELTQASATMALRDEQFIRYLPESYRSWFGQYVDKELGGVWMHAGSGAKQHLWKNAYHETELALVASVTTALLKKQPFSLFYSDSQTQFQPYFYQADVQAVIPAGFGRKRVIFQP